MVADARLTSDSPDSIADQRVGSLVEAMAGRLPLPAAGAAIALTLSMSAALIETAASAPRSGTPTDSAAQRLARRMRIEALRLADEDAAAYARVVAARGDSQRRNTARSHAADPPLRMAELGVKLACLAEQILDDVLFDLQGEVRSAGRLACAAASSAAELATIDLGTGGGERAARASELSSTAGALATALTNRELRR